MARWKKFAAPVLSAAIFAIACWLIYREVRDFGSHDIVAAFTRISWPQRAAALALTAAAYGMFVGYDLLATRLVGRRLPLWQIALAAFLGYAAGNNFGLVLGGSTVRYRLYTSWGLSATDVVNVMAVLCLTFWLGLFALAGMVFVAEPIPIPPVLHVPLATVRPVGYTLLAAVAIWVAIILTRKQPLTIRNWVLPLPDVRFTLMQMALACSDFATAAAVAYVLMPKSVALSYPMFLSCYLLAVLAGVVLHVPGGLGVVELVLLKILPEVPKDELLGALIVFRLFYYFVPLCIAGVIFALHELRQGARKLLGRGA
ncbi:MAG TPA: lysylphosphatidylglycerol synthase domain-containing protein [Pirellulaceae bacterium]|nr:lysylphosphatidylglycerol synthase domain-containing protein [Pirellulaceae bacterium]